MKKIILIAAIGITMVSCDKDGTTSNNVLSADGESVELTEDEKNASYAYGISLGQNTERYSQNPQLKDSLDYSEVERGINEYLSNPEEQASYAYGLSIGQQIQGALDNKVIKGHLDKSEIVNGMMDYLNQKDLRVSKDSVATLMDRFYQNQMKKSSENNKKKGIAYLNDVKQQEGVQTTESGLAYKVLQEGSGEKPTVGDKVKVKYTGKTIDGEVFDGTDKNNKGEAIEFPLNPGGLIPGWIEAMQLMPTGSKYQFYIPSELAYGNQGSGNIGPGETLIFDIELVDVTKGEAPVQSAPTQQGGVKITPKSN